MVVVNVGTGGGPDPGSTIQDCGLKEGTRGKGSPPQTKDVNDGGESTAAEKVDS